LFQKVHLTLREDWSFALPPGSGLHYKQITKHRAQCSWVWQSYISHSTGCCL